MKLLIRNPIWSLAWLADRVLFLTAIWSTFNSFIAYNLKVLDSQSTSNQLVKKIVKIAHSTHNTFCLDLKSYMTLKLPEIMIVLPDE